MTESHTSGLQLSPVAVRTCWLLLLSTRPISPNTGALSDALTLGYQDGGNCEMILGLFFIHLESFESCNPGSFSGVLEPSSTSPQSVYNHSWQLALLLSSKEKTYGRKFAIFTEVLSFRSVECRLQTANENKQSYR